MRTTTTQPSMPSELSRSVPDQDDDLTPSLDELLSHDETLGRLKTAVAEGDADVEAGRVEEASLVFARLRAEFGY